MAATREHAEPAQAIDYVRLMDTTWLALNATAAGQQALFDALPPAESALLCSGTTGPGARLEMARRRKKVADVLLEHFPVTFFSYYALTGPEGVLRFLESTNWRARGTQPGSCYPPAASSCSVYATYLHDSGWIASQEQWLREAFAFEEAYLFPAGPLPARVLPEGRVGLAAGAWVAEASFDVTLYGEMLRTRARNDPWSEALNFAKRRPKPTAVISIPAADGGHVRRIKLSGDPVRGLRWLWDPAEQVPLDATDGALFRHAVSAGMISDTGW